MLVKKFLLHIIISISLTACASAKRIPILDFSKRIYQTCPPEWVEDFLGNICFRQCVNRSLIRKTCKEWFVDVKNLNDQASYQMFRDFEIRVPKDN